jgi:hypothetical protein
LEAANFSAIAAALAKDNKIKGKLVLIMFPCAVGRVSCAVGSNPW